MYRLSCLPDEIICNVLSFLPTKRSVQTSVLSTRWRFLWTQVPFLEFHVCDTAESEIFTKIVLQGKHDIHTFHLCHKDLDGSEDEFQSWIANITTRNVRNLVMDLNNQFALPRCVFTCRTLVDLSISHSGDIPTSGIYFPALKKLKLKSVGNESHGSFAHLISGCPVLEELIIKRKVFGHCCVSSSTLTRLVIKSYVGEVFDFGVKIDTPALRYLRLHCPMPDLLSVGTLDSLVEADIRLCWDEPHQDNFIYSRNLLAFVGKLYNVKHLNLSAHHVAEVHDSAFFASAIMFHNLTKLELCSNLGLIKSFLENATNLQVLEIICLTADRIDNQFYWMEPKRIPACLMTRLQTVNVYFCGSKDEFDMLSYILTNAKVLTRMEIHITSHKYFWKKEFGSLVRRALFERRLKDATSCLIEIV